MKVLAFCQGNLVPSTRFRIFNLISLFRKGEIEISIANAKISSYPPDRGVLLRLIWLLKELLHRIPQVISSSKYDIVIIQREMISTLLTFERFTKKPRILDVDDAIWLHRSGRAANLIAQRVDYIVCGNAFLASYYSKFNKPITVIPTAVDVNRFVDNIPSHPKNIIGWSGTSSGFKFLYSIEESLAKVLTEYPTWRLRVVSDTKPVFKQIPEERVEFIKWTPENEVSTIQDMTIGVMPIDDTDWAKGKCSFKMLLYMACKVPVVVSNYGMNKEVLNHAFVGYGATTKLEWFNSLEKFIRSSELRFIAGENGRKVVVDNYSLEMAARKWAEVLHQMYEK